MVSILVFLELALGHRWSRCMTSRLVSILVFLELALGLIFRLSQRVMVVSILVFLELALGWPILNPMACIAVSILVFLELALGHQWNVSDAHKFQSLFSWNLPSDETRMLTRYQYLVSILVFLELALGRLRILLLMWQHKCFNPCFLGTCPRTVMNLGNTPGARFQSLFSWNLPSDKIAG